MDRSKHEELIVEALKDLRENLDRFQELSLNAMHKGNFQKDEVDRLVLYNHSLLKYLKTLLQLYVEDNPRLKKMLDERLFEIDLENLLLRAGIKDRIE